MLSFLFVLLLFVCPGWSVFQRLYCSIADSCDCDFKPNIHDLEWDLYKNVFGQHFAQDMVSQEVARFVQDGSPARPLVLSFHGASGTGKTLVSWMVAAHLYSSAVSSPYVHQFVPTLHFPLAQQLDQYKEELVKWVQGNLTQCARSVFIFDEMEKMLPGLVDVLEPLLGPSYSVFSTNYRKAIYIFISTTGEEVINRVTLEKRRCGGEREDIDLVDLEDGVLSEIYNSNTSGFFRSRLVQQKLLTHVVPFLPLSRCHVERCARQQLLQRGVSERNDVVEAVGGAMSYSPDTHFFSTTGCKNVPAKINFFL